MTVVFASLLIWWHCVSWYIAVLCSSTELVHVEVRYVVWKLCLKWFLRCWEECERLTRFSGIALKILQHGSLDIWRWSLKKGFCLPWKAMKLWLHSEWLRCGLAERSENTRQKERLIFEKDKKADENTEWDCVIRGQRFSVFLFLNRRTALFWRHTCGVVDEWDGSLQLLSQAIVRKILTERATLNGSL